MTGNMNNQDRHNAIEQLLWLFGGKQEPLLEKTTWI
jgi:hypothetical protein